MSEDKIKKKMSKLMTTVRRGATPEERSLAAKEMRQLRLQQSKKMADNVIKEKKMGNTNKAMATRKQPPRAVVGKPIDRYKAIKQEDSDEEGAESLGSSDTSEGDESSDEYVPSSEESEEEEDSSEETSESATDSDY